MAEVREGQNQCRRQISEQCCCYQAKQVGFDQCWGWDLCKKNVTVPLGRVFNKNSSVLGTSDGILWSQRVVSVLAGWIRCKPECLSTCELGCLPICRLMFCLSLFPLDLHKLKLLSLPISDGVASSLNSCHIPPKVEFAAFQWWVAISGFAQEGCHMETELNSGPLSSNLRYIWDTGLSMCRQLPRARRSWHSCLDHPIPGPAEAHPRCSFLGSSWLLKCFWSFFSMPWAGSRWLQSQCKGWTSLSDFYLDPVGPISLRI